MRKLEISEEFGLFRVSGSNGVIGTGPNLLSALSKFASESGIGIINLSQAASLGAIFDKTLPKEEINR